MQHSFSTDPTLGERLFDLLDTVFPGLRQVAANARALGAPWESVSTPFIVREGARVLSHVGVIELSLIVLGEKVTVGSIHGVATHPDCRRRGHYRQVVEESLRYCDQRYATQILTTEHPEYFESLASLRGLLPFTRPLFCGGSSEFFRGLPSANRGACPERYDC